MTKDLDVYEKKVALHLEAYSRAAAKKSGDVNGNMATVEMQDPLDFWTNQGACDFKTNIAEFCQDLMCVPCTSTSSEHLFSAAVFFHKIDQLESMQQMLWFNCPALLSLSVYLCFVFVLLPTNFAFVA